MNFIQHPTNNAVFGAPVGWDQDVVPCSALPVTITELDGAPAVASFWKPTAEELHVLVDGGSVVLYVLGTCMQPVALAITPGCKVEA
ncbi:hypothetical protein [Collimonas fungivorans]|uniref:hypothetical protein n=1 Tax=Collimonas fungivorans TaxID=158899 RepID=UPI00059F2717|nr:hypothetical protein [Collimonas fungivorans]